MTAVATRPQAEEPQPAVPGLPAAPGEVSLATGRGAVSLGALLASMAQLMALAPLVAVWFAARAASLDARQGWPPRGVHPGIAVPVTISVTVLMSAFSAQWVAVASRRGDRRNALIASVLTIGLGVAIINAQSFAYTQLHLPLAKNAYATLYFALTAFHLLGVAVGGVWFAVAAARSTAGHVGADDSGVGAAAAVWWNATNVVWVVVFLVIYLFT